MNRLLLLALPTVLLAACTQPQANGETAPAAPAAAPTGTATATAASVPAAAAGAAAPAARADGFTEVAVIRAAATLPRNQWRLAEATDAKGARIGALLARPAQPVTVDFQGGRVIVSNTCNAMEGRYTMAGNKITIDPLASTKKACADPALAAIDSELGKRLAGPLAIRLSKAEPVRLELTTAGGEVLLFAGAARATRP